MNKIKESVIQKAILEWLGAQEKSKGWSFHRVNPSRMVGGGAGGAKRIIPVPDMVGQADIIGCYKGRYVALEVKSATGKQSLHQRAFQVRIEAAGGLYALVRSIEDVEKVIEAI